MNKIRTVIERENYVGIIEEVEGFAFVHLEVKKWNKSVLKDIQEEIQCLLLECQENGYDGLNFTVPSDNDLRFHNMVRPVDIVYPFHNGKYILGYWEAP